MDLTLYGFCTPRVAAESLNGVKYDCKSANSESREHQAHRELHFGHLGGVIDWQRSFYSFRINVSLVVKLHLTQTDNTPLHIYATVALRRK